MWVPRQVSRSSSTPASRSASWRVSRSSSSPPSRSISFSSTRDRAPRDSDGGGHRGRHLDRSPRAVGPPAMNSLVIPRQSDPGPPWWTPRRSGAQLRGLSAEDRKKC